MKKIALSILAAMLLVTLVSATALAATGDMTIKAVKAYNDPQFTKYIGTIPKYTSVQVHAYGTYADIEVNGVRCYIKPSALTKGSYENSYMGTATLAKGALIYQRPTTSAKYVKNKKSAKVYVYAVEKGLALVRTGKGTYAFVKVEDLSNLKAK